MFEAHQTLAAISQGCWPALANHLWQTTLMALLAWMLLRLIRPKSARIRYVVLALALLRFVVPAAAVQSLFHQTLLDRTAALTHSVIGAESGARLMEFTEPFTQLTVPVEAVATSPWPVWLLNLWLFGAMAALLFWLVRLWLAWLSLRGGQACESGAAYETFCQLRQWLGVRQSVTLWLMPQSYEPCVWGWWRPRVVVPADLVTQLDEDELTAILRHELLHVQRRDNWRSAVQMLIACVFWFHPLVWWLDRRLTAETETLCDEAVVRFGSSPEIYARSLWKAAQVSLGWSSQGNSWAHHANLSRLITGTSLKERIKLMLNSNQFAENKWRSIVRATFVLGGWTAVALALALFSPKLTAASNALLRSWQTQTRTLPVMGGGGLPMQITDAVSSLTPAEEEVGYGVDESGNRVKLRYPNYKVQTCSIRFRLQSLGGQPIQNVSVAVKNEIDDSFDIGLVVHRERLYTDEQGGLFFATSFPLNVDRGEAQMMDVFNAFTIKLMGVRLEGSEWQWTDQNVPQKGLRFAYYQQGKDSGSEETVYEMKDVEGRPTILHKEKADYTKEARDNDISGMVVLNVVFRKDASITNIRVVRGLPHGLTEKAIEAAQKIRFKPAQKGGQSVSVRANLEYSFQTK